MQLPVRPCRCKTSRVLALHHREGTNGTVHHREKRYNSIIKSLISDTNFQSSQHETLPRNESSPPDRKRPRRSPLNAEQAPPMTTMNFGQQPPQGGVQGGPPQMSNGPMRPMGAPAMNGFNQATMQSMAMGNSPSMMGMGQPMQQPGNAQVGIYISLKSNVLILMTRYSITAHLCKLHIKSPWVAMLALLVPTILHLVVHRELALSSIMAGPWQITG